MSSTKSVTSCVETGSGTCVTALHGVDGKLNGDIYDNVLKTYVLKNADRILCVHITCINIRGHA